MMFFKKISLVSAEEGKAPKESDEKEKEKNKDLMISASKSQGPCPLNFSFSAETRVVGEIIISLNAFKIKNGEKKTYYDYSTDKKDADEKAKKEDPSFVAEKLAQTISFRFKDKDKASEQTKFFLHIEFDAEIKGATIKPGQNVNQLIIKKKGKDSEEIVNVQQYYENSDKKMQLITEENLREMQKKNKEAMKAIKQKEINLKEKPDYNLCDINLDKTEDFAHIKLTPNNYKSPFEIYSLIVGIFIICFICLFFIKSYWTENDYKKNILYL